MAEVLITQPQARYVLVKLAPSQAATLTAARLLPGLLAVVVPVAYRPIVLPMNHTEAQAVVEAVEALVQVSQEATAVCTAVAEVAEAVVLRPTRAVQVATGDRGYAWWRLRMTANDASGGGGSVRLLSVAEKEMLVQEFLCIVDKTLKEYQQKYEDASLIIDMENSLVTKYEGPSDE